MTFVTLREQAVLEVLGRTTDGSGTKLHKVVEATGLPSQTTKGVMGSLIRKGLVEVQHFEDWGQYIETLYRLTVTEAS